MMTRLFKKARRGFNRLKQLRKLSETSKCRGSLAQFCQGDGLDIGFGGDPIVPHAICMDLPQPYAGYRNHPQHLHGDARNLWWFTDNCLDFVYSSHVLEDFEDTAAILDEWLRVCKVGGLLVLYLPDEQLYRDYCRRQGNPPNAHHIHDDFGLDFVKRILQQRCDVQVVHEESPSGIYNLELVVRKTSL